jgi:FlaA1/EpsC-like NDP-sugar epimerase
MSSASWRLPNAVPRWWLALARRSVRVRRDAVLALLDAVLVAVAYLVMLVARYDASVPDAAWSGFAWFLLLAVVVHLGCNAASGLYGPVWQQASIREAQRLLVAGGSAGLIVVGAVLVLSRFAPVSVAAVGSGIATGLFGLLRFQSRLFAFQRGKHPAGTNVLIVGAGESAGALLRELARDQAAELRPLALLDDDPRKLGRRLAGVPIVGSIDDLAQVGRDFAIDVVLLAIPSATSTLVRRVADAAAEIEASLKVLPGVSDFVNGHARLRDVRDLSIDDLLGRQQVSTDLASVAALVRGRRVLVTGAGGSIGSEIARQVADYEPAELLLLDNDETHLFEIASTLPNWCTQVLVDIRDSDRVHRLFRTACPQVVFHTAAHKHVPLLEAHPCEAVATNVLGTENVVLAARETGVKHLVFISTDKAVNPSSVMGASKRMGEHLVLSSAPEGASWSAVRFGNVLGSRGSVVPTFMRQIQEGGPVTLTHPEMTRFFMSIPEAVQLVLQAAALSDDHEVFMLDMGEPVRILDLATRMISLAGFCPGVDIEIEVTGLRPGEKLHEELHTPEEDARFTTHPNIMQLRPRVPRRDVLLHTIRQLAACVERGDDRTARELLFGMASSHPRIIRLPDVVEVQPAVRGGGMA